MLNRVYCLDMSVKFLGRSENKVQKLRPEGAISTKIPPFISNEFDETVTLGNTDNENGTPCLNNNH